MGSGVSLDKVQEPVSVEFPSISSKRHSLDTSQRRRAPIEKPVSRQKTLSEVEFPPPPSEFFNSKIPAPSRLQSERIQVSSRTGSNCSINPSLAVPTIGPNFCQTGLYRNSTVSSRASTSHTLKTARVQQKRTINCESVSSLNLPPPPPILTQSRGSRAQCESRLLSKRGETLPSIAITQRTRVQSSRVSSLPKRENSARSSKSVPNANAKADIHKELLKKASFRQQLTTEDIETKIQEQKDKRKGSLRHDDQTLIGILNQGIERVRKAVDNEADEEDSGYLDDWGTEQERSPTISDGVSPLISPSYNQIRLANQKAYEEVEKAKLYGNGNIMEGKKLCVNNKFVGLFLTKLPNSIKFHPCKSIDLMKMEEKRRNIDRLLSDTPTSDAPAMSIKTVSSMPTRSVKVEDELLDAVEERVRKVLQDWSIDQHQKSGTLPSIKQSLVVKYDYSKTFSRSIYPRQRKSSLSDEETLLDSDLESLRSWTFSERSNHSNGQGGTRIISYRPINKHSRILASMHSVGEAAYYRNIHL
ncbi:Oidioi.mRNA.OKI2018_I69.XSR.g15249.t1.cds [Oikopleura dioica]|uniref:Oidioi.mRNA.OKI2018_I69.XSR.g15249.t1.cds n=1 Tax=Oikopleura dioica TaxID=34765 RepID=A0ABN7SCQ8_OIKDI|nr:Oidioi.mRNA.OKI2018_I69.XSR.g15249.t1.cds [Oikopleura dioica]